MLENLFKWCSQSLGSLLGVNSDTQRVKEAVDFNPANVKFIEGNDVAYGLSYQDNGDGTSKVKLLVSPSYPLGKPGIHNIGNIRNEFKDQLSLTLIKDSAEINKVGIIFPEEGSNKKGEKCIKGFLFNTYEVKLSVGAPSVKHLGTTRLQKHINNDSPVNVDNSYSHPEVVKISDNQVLVTAKNLEDETLDAWILNKNKKSGKFEAFKGKKNIIERKLLKDSPDSQFVLNGSTLLYLRVKKRIVENQERRITEIFKFDTAEVVKHLKKGKGIDEYLLGNKEGQIDKVPFFSRENEISLLQYVIEQDKDNDVVAFLEKDPSSNTQVLRLVGFRSGEPLLSFPIYRFKDSIEQLYVKEDSQGGFIVTAVSGENVITFYAKSFEESPKVIIIPVSEIETFSDFVGIINGQLTPSIASSSTIAPMTVTEDEGYESSKEPTPTTPITESDSSSQSSSIATEEDEGYSSSEESTAPSQTTPNLSTVGKSTVTGATPKDATPTERVVGSTNAPTTPNSPTQKVFTISTKGILTEKSSTPMFTTPMLPQANSSPQPPQTVFTMSTKEILTTEKSTSEGIFTTEKPTIATENTDGSTQEPTPNEFSAITPKDATPTGWVVGSTNAPAISNEPTDGSTPGPAPEPHDFSAAAARNTEIGAVGGFLGASGMVGLIGFTTYKCLKRNRRRNNAESPETQHSDGSDILFIGNTNSSSEKSRNSPASSPSSSNSELNTTGSEL